jgi:hypothetical protein
MRLLIENYGDAQIYLDRSPDGIKRYIVTYQKDPFRTILYNSVWYPLDFVKEKTLKSLA